MVLAVVVVAVLIYAAWWLMKNKLPPRDRPLTIAAAAEPGRAVAPERLQAERERMLATFLRPGLVEQVALIALVLLVVEWLVYHRASLARLRKLIMSEE